MRRTRSNAHISRSASPAPRAKVEPLPAIHHRPQAPADSDDDRFGDDYSDDCWDDPQAEVDAVTRVVQKGGNGETIDGGDEEEGAGGNQDDVVMGREMEQQIMQHGEDNEFGDDYEEEEDGRYSTPLPPPSFAGSPPPLAAPIAAPVIPLVAPFIAPQPAQDPPAMTFPEFMRMKDIEAGFLEPLPPYVPPMWNGKVRFTFPFLEPNVGKMAPLYPKGHPLASKRATAPTSQAIDVPSTSTPSSRSENLSSASTSSVGKMAPLYPRDHPKRTTASTSPAVYVRPTSTPSSRSKDLSASTSSSRSNDLPSAFTSS